MIFLKIKAFCTSCLSCVNLIIYLVNIFVDAVGELDISKSKSVGSNINVFLCNFHN